MKKNLQILKKTVLTLAILLMTTASAWAEDVYITINNGQTVSTNYHLNSGESVYITVSSGTGTYSGVISGGYSQIEKRGGGKAIITNVNTVACSISIDAGTLQFGNGTTNGTFNNMSNMYISSGATLRFEPGTNMTFEKVISGEGGKVEYKGSLSKQLTLTGNNTYTGTTTIESQGILHIGSNTTTGAIAGNIVNNNGMLYFRRSDAYTYSGAISGAGSVSQSGSGTLAFTGTNTYEGGTTIAADCMLQIGDNTTTGSIKGNVTNNGTLRFYRSNNYTYEGIISGTGDVTKYGSTSTGILTLSGVNTYTGATIVYSKLALTGSIEKSSEVRFMSANGKLDISSGNKKIQSLTCGLTSGPVPVFYTGEVVLGERTLTIGTAGQDNGGGVFYGIFSGTGSVTKTGTESFSMRGDNTATGTFTHSQGTVNFSGTWKGNYNKAADATLTVTGNPTIGGKLTLVGGTINMNVTAATPSKITVDGIVAASGTNTLKITATTDVTNYVLIQASGGIPEIWPYTVNSATLDDPKLSANGTQLLLTAKLGIEEFGVTNLRVYPNPTTGVLNLIQERINNEQLTINNVEIYDIYGKKLSFNHLITSSSNHLINISHLPAGVYFLRIETENKMITQKIIKN